MSMNVSGRSAMRWLVLFMVAMVGKVHGQEMPSDCGRGLNRSFRKTEQVLCDSVVRPYQKGDYVCRYVAEKASQVFYRSKNRRVVFRIGGKFDLKFAYDFGGAVQHPYFVPALIDVPKNPAHLQQIRLSATSSKLFLKGEVDAGRLGCMQTIFEMDLNGGDKKSYLPRLRRMYLRFLGLTFGRDYTGFCDLGAVPNTIDAQQPNAYTYALTTQISYRVSFYRRHFDFFVGMEIPEVTGRYNEFFSKAPQRVPDFPMYLQYKWGQTFHNHLRLSAVLRNLYFYNKAKACSMGRFAWGVEVSGHLKGWKWMEFFFSGEIGQGIASYVGDLSHTGLDLSPLKSNPHQMVLPRVWGWQIASQVNLYRGLVLSGGYSMVKVEDTDLSEDAYRKGTYLFANLFYTFGRHFQVAGEYLHGQRVNQNGEENSANRLQLLLRYLF